MKIYSYKQLEKAVILLIEFGTSSFQEFNVSVIFFQFITQICTLYDININYLD